jgi:hypothetical protein
LECSAEITILFCIDQRLQNIKGTRIVGLAAVVGLLSAAGNLNKPHYSALKKVIYNKL